jgi:hypothetical protein
MGVLLIADKLIGRAVIRGGIIRERAAFVMEEA